jgi:hypothetical protein
MISRSLAIRAASLMFALAVSACGPQNAPPGTPGSVVVHMGGSMAVFAGAASNR